MVDTYGIPTYKEANPMLVSLVTFPILFGMMFGDIGHGSILMFFGLYLTWKHDPKDPGVFGVARYFFLTNGMAAVYCGLIYNEFFAMKLNLFDSCYDIKEKIAWYPSNYQFDSGMEAGSPVDLTKYPNAHDSNYPKNDHPMFTY